MNSKWRPVVTGYLGCMVSEITRFYDKPDMTFSWFLRQVSLCPILHDGFSTCIMLFCSTDTLIGMINSDCETEWHENVTLNMLAHFAVRIAPKFIARAFKHEGSNHDSNHELFTLSIACISSVHSNAWKKFKQSPLSPVRGNKPPAILALPTELVLEIDMTLELELGVNSIF